MAAVANPTNHFIRTHAPAYKAPSSPSLVAAFALSFGILVISDTSPAGRFWLTPLGRTLGIPRAHSDCAFQHGCCELKVRPVLAQPSTGTCRTSVNPFPGVEKEHTPESYFLSTINSFHVPWYSFYLHTHSFLLTLSSSFWLSGVPAASLLQLTPTSSTSCFPV